jgi:phosphopantetheinyl transferase
MIDYQLLPLSASQKVSYATVNYSIESELKKDLSAQGVNLEGYYKIANTKRKIEWLTVRKLLSLIHNERDDISYDVHRKPHFIKSHHHLSISHSHNMIAVCIDQRSPTGIDIQFINDKIIRIKRKFLNEEEQAKTSDDPFELTCYWSIKEALFKVYGKKDAFLKEHIEVNTINYQADRIIASGSICCNGHFSKHSLEVKRIGNYVLAYVVIP